MAPSVYDLLKTFDAQNKFDGTNYTSWIRELEMTFGEDEDLLAHIKGTSPAPAITEKTELASWTAVDARARLALYKTISSNPVREAHFKETIPSQTAKEVFDSLKSEYQKDSRASRFELKKRLYNPVHDPEKPVSEYIQDIIAASDALTALGHPPSSLDVVDSILMNLDNSFAIVRTLLTSQATEPTLSSVKKMLTDQEDTRLALSGGDGLYESANFSKSRNGARGRHRSQDSSDDGPTYDWLNPRNNDVCHRCGLPGHRSSRCIADMPQKIKDKVIKEAKDRRKMRSSSPEDNAHVLRFAASDHDDFSSDDGSTDDEEMDLQRRSCYARPANDNEENHDKAVRKEARALLRRLQA